MKKPASVEVGQWWGDTKQPGCFRVEGIINKLDEDWALYGEGKFVASCGLLLKMSTSVYLGSGDHPEPSDWMIETLAEHAMDVAQVTAEWRSHAVNRKVWTDRARAALDAKPIERDELLIYQRPLPPHQLAVLSLYSILRSLGKW